MVGERWAGRKLKEENLMKKRTPYSLPVSALPAPLMSAPFIQPLHLHPVYGGWGGGFVLQAYCYR